MIIWLYLFILCISVKVVHAEADYEPYFDHVEVQWFAPFLSGGGYSSEAMAFAGVLDQLDSVTSIERRALSKEAASKDEVYVPENILPFSLSFNMRHHGDSPNQEHIEGLTIHEKNLMEAHFDLPNPRSGGLDGREAGNIPGDGTATATTTNAGIPSRRDKTIVLGGKKGIDKKILQIVVCHSEPGAWHAPTPKYHTTRCPPPSPGQANKNNKKKKPTNIIFKQYTIGRTMFETDSVPSGWPARLNHMNEIWVPTLFASNIFSTAMGTGIHGMGSNIDNKSNSVHIVEEPVDTHFYYPIDYNTPVASASTSTRTRSLGFLPSTLNKLESYLQSKSSIFLFVGKWEERKGIRMLIRAFFKAFDNDNNDDNSNNGNDDGGDDAVLVITTSAYHSTGQFDDEIQKILVEEGLNRRKNQNQNQNHISRRNGKYKYLLLTNIPQDHMPHLFSAATALVIPSAGEGWGRPHVESMACGTPVIATSWSGPTSYLTQDNGYPLRVSAMQDAGPWTGHKWALPDETHLVQLLQDVHRDMQSLASGKVSHENSPLVKKGRQARQDMVKKFSYEAFAKTLGSELQRVERTAAEIARKEREMELESEVDLEIGMSSQEL